MLGGVCFAIKYVTFPLPRVCVRTQKENVLGDKVLIRPFPAPAPEFVER